MRSLGRVRRGASLAELLVSVLLLAIAGGSALGALDRQARLHAALLTRFEARGRHAATHELIAVTLRGVSPPAGDLVALQDSAVVFRQGLGGGVTCRAAGTTLVLAPDSLANGQALARIATSPQAGDTLWLLHEGPTDAAIDDSWAPVPVASAARAAAGCLPGGIVTGADAALPSWRFDLAAAVPAGISPGVPARLTRWARLSLYRSGTSWWLGYADWNAGGGWNAIQPVSGPWLPAIPGAPGSGLALGPRAASGGPAGAPPGVALLALSTRTRTDRRVRFGGMPAGFAPDSLASLVALRNAR